MANFRARGFMSELEKGLKEPSDKTRLVLYQKESSTNMLVVSAVVPPKGFEQLPIAVRAQQNNKVVGAWNISAKGEVMPRSTAQNPEGSTRSACNATVNLANRELKEMMTRTTTAPTAN